MLRERVGECNCSLSPVSPQCFRLQKPKRTNQELTTRAEQHAVHSYAMFADRL